MKEKSHEEKVEIHHTNDGYSVVFNGQHVGQTIPSFVIAYGIAKEYAQHYQASLSISKETIEQVNIKAELDTLAVQIGLRKGILDGLADKIEQYMIEHSAQRSFSSFINWLEKANRTMMVH